MNSQDLQNIKRNRLTQAEIFILESFNELKIHNDEENEMILYIDDNDDFIYKYNNKKHILEYNAIILDGIAQRTNEPLNSYTIQKIFIKILSKRLFPHIKEAYFFY